MFRTLKKYLVVFLLGLGFSCLFALSACSENDRDQQDCLVGKKIELKKTLLVVENIKSASITNSPTILELDRTSLSIESLTSCAGCNFSSLKLSQVLPAGSNIKIIRSFVSEPPFIHIGSSAVHYYIVQSENNLLFGLPDFLLQDMRSPDPSYNNDAHKIENLFALFEDKKELRSFYFQAKPFYQNSLYPHKNSFSSDDVKSTFQESFQDITRYNITDIKTDSGQLAFSVTTDREGFAYLVLKTSEKYVSISPYQKIN